MRINANFSQFCAVKAEKYQWVKSPQNGVERVMLDRVGAEKARATSIVRYAANSYFPSHTHPGGEEILVLSGTFSEQTSDGIKHDYPAGYYLRSPSGSEHTPYSKEGAVIFVKLWQMSPSDDQLIRLNTADPSLWRQEKDRENCLLFKNDHEQVSLERLKPGASLFNSKFSGAEILLLSGALTSEKTRYKADSWLRLPSGYPENFYAGEEGALCYLKLGALGNTTLSSIDE
ncbi:cupin domain-containing protein [Marinomonas pollencensis]|uniref:ChrR-like anti-ECFsigma factor n=1 Tax=Marinomonas pollencensis TaxID=491954 RepID=A0A3E0DTC7_9GAMM|nr:cupin domain-containing protein [Marinomonas pollencensis]REG85723.1 ChrR-like anti-ECFsigma factor [Marinomonas pollencensis]